MVKVDEIFLDEKHFADKNELDFISTNIKKLSLKNEILYTTLSRLMNTSNICLVSDTDDSVPMSFDDVQEVSLAAEYFMFSSQVDGEPDILSPSPKSTMYSVSNSQTMPPTNNGAISGGVPDMQTSSLRNNTVIKTESPFSSLIVGGGSSNNGGVGSPVLMGQQRHQVARPANTTTNLTTTATTIGLGVGGGQMSFLSGVRPDVSTTPDNTYSCELCPAKLKNKRNFDTHMKRHRGELPFKCDECTSTFANKSALTAHIRTHTGERPYQCDHCPSAFNQLIALKRHRKSKHKQSRAVGQGQ